MWTAAMFVFFLLVLGQDGVRGQSDETTDCSKPSTITDFMKLPTDCCKIPRGPLFSDTNLGAALKECKQTPELLAWANSYKMNTLQSKDDLNFININNEKNIKVLCPIAEFMNCVFTKGLLFYKKTDLLDTKVILNLMIQTIGSDWQEVLTKLMKPINTGYSGTYHFHEIVMEQYKKITCPSGDVNLIPLLFMQMLQSEIIWLCPEVKLYTSVNTCLNKMKEFQYCDGQIFDPKGKGVFFFKSKN